MCLLAPRTLAISRQGAPPPKRQFKTQLCVCFCVFTEGFTASCAASICEWTSNCDDGRCDDDSDDDDADDVDDDDD